MAVSTASAPVFIGSTISMPASAASSAQNGPNWSCSNARLTSVTRSSWRCAAATSRGWRWPKLMRRVGREHVQVAAAVDVGDPGALGLGDHDRQRVVVVRAVGRGLGAQLRCRRVPPVPAICFPPGPDGRELPEFQGAALGPAAGLEQLRHVDPDRLEAAAASWAARPVACSGSTTWRPSLIAFRPSTSASSSLTSISSAKCDASAARPASSNAAG